MASSGADPAAVLAAESGDAVAHTSTSRLPGDGRNERTASTDSTSPDPAPDPDNPAVPNGAGSADGRAARTSSTRMSGIPPRRGLLPDGRPRSRRAASHRLSNESVRSESGGWSTASAAARDGSMNGDSPCVISKAMSYAGTRGTCLPVFGRNTARIPPVRPPRSPPPAPAAAAGAARTSTGSPAGRAAWGLSPVAREAVSGTTAGGFGEPPAGGRMPATISGLPPVAGSPVREPPSATRSGTRPSAEPRGASNRVGDAPRSAIRCGAPAGGARRRESSVPAKNISATIDSAAATAPPSASRSMATGQSLFRRDGGPWRSSPSPPGPARRDDFRGVGNGSVAPSRMAAIARRVRSSSPFGRSTRTSNRSIAASSNNTSGATRPAIPAGVGTSRKRASSRWSSKWVMWRSSLD